MKLRELIDSLVAVRDSVISVDGDTEVVFVTDGHETDIDGLRLVSDPAVRYGAVSLSTRMQLLGPGA